MDIDFAFVTLSIRAKLGDDDTGEKPKRSLIVWQNKCNFILSVAKLSEAEMSEIYEVLEIVDNSTVVPSNDAETALLKALVREG